MQEMKAKELKSQVNIDNKDVKNLGNEDEKEKELKSNANSNRNEKDLKSYGNGDMNSHLCKVCFESQTAAILLPCRHFCCEFRNFLLTILPLMYLNLMFLTCIASMLQCVNHVP